MYVHGTVSYRVIATFLTLSQKLSLEKVKLAK